MSEDEVERGDEGENKGWEENGMLGKLGRKGK